MNPVETTSPTTLFGGAAIIGILVGVWNYIKLYFSKIVSIFIVVYEVDDVELSVALAIYS